MNKDKVQNQNILGTLVNKDESGIIAYSDQIYDKKSDRSLEEENVKQNERLDNVEAKDREFQSTLENITKTGEASAASNVSYNHNDSQLDASNVQQAIDEVYSKGNTNRENDKTKLEKSISDNKAAVDASIQDVYKRSNYNDDDNIIDFNTIHLITDNPEFVCVAVDVNEKILYGIKTDGQPYFGVGCPQQVKDYIDEQINKILGTDDITTTIDSLKEIEAFLKDFTNSDTLKKLLDLKANVDEVRITTNDIYKKSNPNDSEGNVVDTNTIVSIENNPEYIKVITDNVGKLIEAIGLDGIRKFFAGIEVQGTLQCVTDNPEYIAVWLDNQERIVFGFKINGDPYFGYGIPSQINSVIELLKSNTKTRIDTLVDEVRATTDDIYKKSNPNDGKGNVVDTNTIFSIKDNPEYIKALTDSVGKLIEVIGIDGIRKFFAGINIQGTLQCVTDNPEFISVELDKLGHILGGWKTDGDYYFGTGVPTQIQLNTRDIYGELSTANAIEIDTDNEGNVYATTGINGNISVEFNDNGDVFLIYDTYKVDIEDAYEEKNGTLIVEQNKVITL